MVATIANTNIPKPTPYRQSMAPSYSKASFVADDTDNHDFRFSTGGKGSILIVADNPSDQTLTVSIYGAPDAGAEIGDADVIKIGTDLTVLTAAAGSRAVGQPWPYYLIRATFSVGPDSETVTIFVNAHNGNGQVELLGVASGISLPIEGLIASGEPYTANPLPGGGKATNDISANVSVDEDDIVPTAHNYKGAVIVAGASKGTNGLPGFGTLFMSEAGDENPLASLGMGLAPDGNTDSVHLAGDSAPGQGALNVAPIGGDVTLRASAVIGEASGVSTEVDNLGWIHSFTARLDVTAAPSGGAPTLDVYVQTEMASGDWQDVLHFTQVTGITHENAAWGGGDGNRNGIGAEGAAITFDRFWADEDASLAAITVRILPMGDSLRTKWVFAAGGSTGDFTFALDLNAQAH